MVGTVNTVNINKYVGVLLIGVGEDFSGKYYDNWGRKVDVKYIVPGVVGKWVVQVKYDRFPYSREWDIGEWEEYLGLELGG